MVAQRKDKTHFKCPLPMIHCQITVSSCAKPRDSWPNAQLFARAFLAYALSCAVQTLSHLCQRVSGFPSSVVPYVKILLVFYVAKIALLFQHSTSFIAGNPAKSAPTHKRKELLCAQGKGEKRPHADFKTTGASLLSAHILSPTMMYFHALPV